MTESELIRRVTLDDLKSITSKMKTSFYGAPVSSVRSESGNQGDEVIKISTTLNGISAVTGYIQITGVTTNSIIDSKVIVNKGQLYVVNSGQIISSCVLIPTNGSCFYIKFDNQQNTAFQIEECTVTAALLNEGEPLYKVITAVEINPEAPTFEEYLQIGTSPYDLDKFPNYSEEGVYQPTNNPTSFSVETAPNEFTVYPNETVFSAIKKATTAHELDHKVTFAVQQVDNPTATSTDFSGNEILLQVPTMMEGKYLPLKGGIMTGDANFQEAVINLFDINHDTEVNITPDTIAINNNLTDKEIQLHDGTVLADKFQLPDGTSNQFLKADGSVDSNSYVLKSELTSLSTSLDVLEESVDTRFDNIKVYIDEKDTEVKNFAGEKCQEVLDHSDEEDGKLKALIEEKTKQYNTIESISQLLTKYSKAPVAPSTLYTGEVVNIYNIKETVNGLQFKFADINGFGSKPVSSRYIKWKFSGNNETLYIGFLRADSVDIQCRFEVVVTSNNITTTHQLGLILDTPGDQVPAVAEVTTMPFTIETKKAATTTVIQYIKVDPGFTGEVKIRLMTYDSSTTPNAYNKLYAIDNDGSTLTSYYATDTTTEVELKPFPSGSDYLVKTDLKVEGEDVPYNKYLNDLVPVDSIYDCSGFAVGSSVPDQILNYLLLYNLKLKTNGN